MVDPGIKLSDTKLLHERIYSDLSVALLVGDFNPGDVLSIRELAGILGTSTMPVRGALSRLISEGALELRQNRSVRVPLLTVHAFDDLSELRIALECKAGAKAATNISKKAIKSINKDNRSMAKCMARTDVREALIHNRNFHFGIYQAAEDPMLFRFIQQLWLRVGPYMHVALVQSLSSEISRANSRKMQTTYEVHHRQLVEALESGDARGVRRGIKGDILTTQSWFHRYQRYEASRGVRPFARSSPKVSLVLDER